MLAAILGYGVGGATTRFNCARTVALNLQFVQHEASYGEHFIGLLMMVVPAT